MIGVIIRKLKDGGGAQKTPVKESVLCFKCSCLFKVIVFDPGGIFAT